MFTRFINWLARMTPAYRAIERDYRAEQRRVDSLYARLIAANEALSEIEQIPAGLANPNGSTRKAARIAREARSQ